MQDLSFRLTGSSEKSVRLHGITGAPTAPTEDGSALWTGTVIVVASADAT